MTEGTFLLHTTERNRVSSRLPTTDHLNHTLPKEGREGMRPRDALHEGSQYIIAGLCAPEHRQGSRASTGTCTGLGWRCSPGKQQGCWLLLTIRSHNRLFPSMGSQVTSHVMQQEGMIRNFLFRQQAVILKTNQNTPTQLPSSSHSPGSSCTEQQYRVHLLQHQQEKKRDYKCN